jgi:hypothetical protein
MFGILVTFFLAQTPDVEALKKENAALKTEVASLKTSVIEGVAEKAEMLKDDKGRNTPMFIITLRGGKTFRYFYVGELTFFGETQQTEIDPANLAKTMTKYHPKVKLTYGNRETGEPVWLWIERTEEYKKNVGFKNWEKSQKQQEDQMKVVPPPPVPVDR